jgi:pre-60S factor REI1
VIKKTNDSSSFTYRFASLISFPREEERIFGMEQTYSKDPILNNRAILPSASSETTYNHDHNGVKESSIDSSSTGMFLTCLACHVVFHDVELQREHYRTDWHRHNLKRQIVNMTPVSAEQFARRVEVQKLEAQTNLMTGPMQCFVCSKTYASENAFKDHLLSRRHKENASRKTLKFTTSIDDGPIATPRVSPGNSTRKPINRVDMTIHEGEDETMAIERIVKEKMLHTKPLTMEDCLFCAHSSDSFEINLKHMAEIHSFFIPDVEYLVDLRGLIRYLGEKVGVGHMCLYCNGKGRELHSVEAVQKHMRDKGHCKLLYEGDAELEIAEFYDFTPSYRDFDETKRDEQAEMEVDKSEICPFIAEEDFQLVLPSGIRLGHRSLKRYYKQRLYVPEVTR